MTDFAESSSTPKGLAGWRVLIPRGGAWGNDVAQRISKRGGDPLIAPLIVQAPPRDDHALQTALDDLARGAFDLVIATSRATAAVLDGRGAVIPEGTRLAAVGAATARALSGAGLHVDIVPEGAGRGAAGLIERLRDEPPGRALLPRSAQAHDDLADGLQKLGWTVTAPVAYRTVGVALSQQALEDVRRGAVDAVLVTSGTVAQQVSIQFGAARAQAVLISIGPQTTDDARAVGLDIAQTAAVPSIDAMLDAVADLAQTGPRRGGATTISRAPGAHGISDLEGTPASSS